MLWQAWRIAALLVAVLGVAFMADDVLTVSGTPGFRVAPVTPNDFARRKVTSVAALHDTRPEVRVGDVLRLHDDSFSERMRFLRQRTGETFVFDRERGSPVTVRLVPAPVPPFAYVFLALALSFVVVGGLLALRTPRLPEARALASMLILLGVVFSLSPQPWMPPALVASVLIGSYPIQFLAFGCAVHLATIFPAPAERGWRALVRRANPFVTAFMMLIGGWIATSGYAGERAAPAPVTLIGRFVWVYFLIAITSSFWIANRTASGADRKRVRWVSTSLAVGFSGVVVNIVVLVARHFESLPWMPYLALTMVAIPLGLGYAIVRHRVIDIGFVVNRALVFGTVSAIVVVAFMVLEWLLGTVLVKVSHVTSTSLELGLALLLGFSLRTIHAKVDKVVDDVFFRSRHEAERALRMLARELAFVTDPRVAIARAHDELVARTGAADAAIYVVDRQAALRVDPAESASPGRVDVDDAALVRLRATRAPLRLREVRSALRGDRAYPMLVRDALSGAVVLGPKTNGEAYAPDEIATVEAVAQALGNALDALQTAALRAEIARVLIDGAPLDALRRTVDSAAWVRGVVPQPAGSLLGLGE
jgi:hypothetical protein